MPRKDRIDAIGAGVLILFSASLGLNQALVKLVNVGMAPAFQAGMRSLLAFTVVLLFAVVARRRLTLRDGSLTPGIITGALFAAEFILLFKSVEYSTIARVSILFYTMPMWVALGAHFLIPGERMTRARALGLLLAVGGVALALSDTLQASGGAAGNDALIGDAMALAGSTFWAAIALIARTTKMGASSPEQQLLYQLAVSAPIMLVFAWFSGDMFRELTNLHIGIFLFQTIGVVSIGFLVWFWVLTIYPASDMASFSFLAPLFGVISGWLIFGERISMSIVGALVLVGLGIVLVNRKPKPS